MSRDGAAPAPAASHHGGRQGPLLRHRHQLPSGQELGIKIPIFAQFGAGKGEAELPRASPGWQSSAAGKAAQGRPRRCREACRCGLLRAASPQAAAGCEGSETSEETAGIRPPPESPSRSPSSRSPSSRPVPSRRGGRASPQTAPAPLSPAAALRMRGRPLSRARFQPLGRVGSSAR